MSKTYFTSDWHLGEDRIGINGKPNLFYRPFDSIRTQNDTIVRNFRNVFNDGDVLWHLGDVLYDKEDIYRLEDLKHFYPNSKFHLIIGNYDEGKMAYLDRVFDSIQHEAEIEVKGKKYYLNHYPSKCVSAEFAITGHIHGLWKVQKNMINVGVDAWHFKPVSEDELDFCRTACEKYYDVNVFPY